jgi:predicted NBD/HSP70 family sugar kinase
VSSEISKETYIHSKRLESYGADGRTVRDFNRQLILNYLRKNGPAPRVTIASDLDLSRATVSTIIDELKKDAFVHEGERINATERGGRRATQVHFNAQAGYIVGIDIGRSHLIIQLSDLEAKPIDTWSDDSFSMIEYGYEDGLEFIADRADTLVKNKLETWSSVRGIGMGIPGSPDSTLHTLISPPLLSKWMHVDIPAYLRNRLKLNEYIPIYLENDANLGALGECRYGAGQGIANLIYVKLGTGISAGLILNGQLYRGSGGLAGEFGHIRIQEDGPTCPYCGSHGCLEALAGRSAILNKACQGLSLSSAHSWKNNYTTNETPASVKYTDEIDIVDVIIEAQNGNAFCQYVLISAGERIGTAIGSYLINVYNPSMILLDWEIIKIIKGDQVYTNKLLLDSLRERVEESSLPKAWNGTVVSLGRLGHQAVVYGAIAAVIDLIYNNNTVFSMSHSDERYKKYKSSSLVSQD